MPQLLEISGSADPMAHLATLTARAKIAAEIPPELRVTLAPKKLEDLILRLRRASVNAGILSLLKAFKAYQQKNYRDALRRSITAVVNAAAAYESDPELAARIISSARLLARKSLARRRA